MGANLYVRISVKSCMAVKSAMEAEKNEDEKKRERKEQCK
jgi:hypothetical protein